MRDRDLIITPQNVTKAIGNKQWLIPKHVHKTVYREGQGNPAVSGSYVYAYYACFLVNGKQIRRKSLQPKKFHVGCDRLIKVLEIGLLETKKYQKFTLIISAEYGYKQIQDFPIDCTNEKLQNEKLVFQFEIVAVENVPFEKKSEIQALAQLKFKVNKADMLAQQKQYYKSIPILEQVISLLYKTNLSRTNLLVMIHLRKAQLLFKMQKYDESLKACKPIQNIDQNNIYLLLFLSKIYLKINKIVQAKKVMFMFYKLNEHNLKAKRIYVQFLKQTGSNYELDNLEGYNRRKDKFYYTKYGEQNYFNNDKQLINTTRGPNIGTFFIN